MRRYWDCQLDEIDRSLVGKSGGRLHLAFVSDILKEVHADTSCWSCVCREIILINRTGDLIGVALAAAWQEQFARFTHLKRRNFYNWRYLLSLLSHKMCWRNQFRPSWFNMATWRTQNQCFASEFFKAVS